MKGADWRQMARMPLITRSPPDPGTSFAACSSLSNALPADVRLAAGVGIGHAGKDVMVMGTMLVHRVSVVPCACVAGLTGRPRMHCI